MARRELTRRLARSGALLQVSAAHVYLTVPFVLSWSMLEAMSAGCLVIGSDTAPVREVIQHGKNGLLVDFFSPLQIADAVDEALAHPDRMKTLRESARRTIIDGYEVRQSLKQYQDLIGSLRRPSKRPDHTGAQSGTGRAKGRVKGEAVS